MAAKQSPTLKPRKSPRQERARATVDAILQATAYILKKQGFASLTTNAIAQKAGVNIASLYQYFPNKEAILAELLRRHVKEGRAKALAIVRGGRSRSLETNVRRLVEGMLAEHSVEPDLHRILTMEAAQLGLPAVETESDAALAEESARWVATTRRKNADLALWIAKTAIHVVVHMAFLERPHDARNPAVLAEELTRLVVRYLAPERPGRVARRSNH